MAETIEYPPVPDVPLEPALERLFWRAGFGPSDADRRRFRREGLGAAIEHLLKPPARRVLRGPQPGVGDGDGALRPLRPRDEYGDDVLWWLDRMVRTRAPLVERMTLNLHDHFATSNEGVAEQSLLLRQNALLRRHALGDFGQLAHGILHDFAMQFWLNLIGSHRDAPNENFARELMELFTLGSGYTEADIREAARALTGFEFDWDGEYSDATRYTWNRDAWDPGPKRIFGRSGRFQPDDVIDLCLRHPAHPPFLCRKLWGYFSPAEPPAGTLAQMTAAYTASGRKLVPVLRVILRSRAFYENLGEPDLVKPPVVFLAGAMRATGTYVRSADWVWLLGGMGQVPFYPPNVGGWNQNEAFLSAAAYLSRSHAVAHVLDHHEFPDDSVPAGETATEALADAKRFAGAPWLSGASDSRLARLAAELGPQWDGDDHWLAERRRVLRHLVLAGPDAQVH